MKALLSPETLLPAFALSYKQRQVLMEGLDVKLTSTSICPYDYHKEAASYRFALSKESPSTMNCPKCGKGNMSGRPKCEFCDAELPVSMARPIVRCLKAFYSIPRLTTMLAGESAELALYLVR
jgi:hypothetical protein